LCVLVKGPTK